MKILHAILAFLRKKPVAIALSFAVTVLALWLVLRGVDFSQAASAIKSMRLFPLLIVFLVLVLGTFLRAWRWHILTQKHGSTIGAAVEAILISVFFTGVLPLRTGEVVRIGYFARRTGASPVSTTAALVLERIMDLATLALIGAVFLSGEVGKKIPNLPVSPGTMGLLAGTVVLAMIAGGFWLASRSRKLRDVKHVSLPARLFNEGLQGLSALESKAVAAQVWALSIGLWLVTMSPGVFLFRSMGMTVSFSAVVIITLGTAMAVAMPSSPGFVGTFHAGFVFAAQLVGIPKEIALPAAIVLHLLTQVPFILAGGLVLATGGRRALVKKDS
jgi:glycosyltransferase 2 family protein